MSSVILSNKSSSVVNALTSKDHRSSDAFVYAMQKGMPNHSKKIVNITKTLSNGNAATHVFTIPKNGLLKRVWLKFQYNGGATTHWKTDGLLNLFNQITLSNNSRVIDYLHPQSIRAYIDSMDDKERVAMNAGVMSSYDAAVANNEIVCYVPLPFNFSRDNNPEKFLDTNFIDYLTLTLDCQAVTSVLTQTNFATGSWMMYAEYVVMENSAYEVYRNKQFMGKPLEYLWKNSFQENQHACNAGAATQTVDLTCDNVITKTRLRVIDSGAANDSFAVHPIQRAPGAGRILSVAFRGNGETLWEADAFELQAMNGGVVTSGADHDVVFSGNLEIDWETHVVNSESDSFLGGLSLKNIAGPQLVVTLSGDAVATDLIDVNHEYLNFVSVSGKNGRMEVSSSL